MSSNNTLERATQATVQNLQLVAKSLTDQRLTKLSLPEVDAVVDLVAKVIPAGNVPGMILSGLTQISGSHVQPQKARQDINILFKEVSLFFVEQAKYGTMFVGPAAIIWGYQNLLKLAGKDAESAFPEGLWQFYVDYALREDTARHANETHGFDTLLKQHQIKLSPVDRLTAWCMASVTTLHQYHTLLASEWYERTSLWLLQEITGKDYYSEWEEQKIYGRDAEAANYDFPSYRRLKFDQYLKHATSSLPPVRLRDWEAKLKAATDQFLLAYQKQLTILAYLDPGSFGETRLPIPLEQAQIGIIHQGNYFLLPICEPGTSKALDVRTARSQIARLITDPHDERVQLAELARLKRTESAGLQKKLNASTRKDLERLHFAPILINCDQGDSSQLLAEIRQGERGVGDHPLTIFDTGKTFVFDQSHIFFDGAWGTALAEIMTNEALSWAAYLNLLSPAMTATSPVFTSLKLKLEPAEWQMIHAATHILPEAGAENDQINLQAILTLKNYFKQRSDLLKLTVNDLLVLYRAIHATLYKPSKGLQQEIDLFKQQQPAPADRLQQALGASIILRPSILIPVDASKRLPRDRVYPMNLEVPLAELDLLNLHKAALGLMTEYQASGSKDAQVFKRFDLVQRTYLATIGGFGTILAKAKEIAVRGESASAGAIKLLAHMPSPIKKLLDQVPARYERLNNLLKGTEVLSNLGAVAKTSSVSRFISAKDDNEQKQLTWGVMTDAQGVMKLSLRDFRPYVALLHEAGRKDLANRIAQDYLDTFVQGLNQFIKEATLIAVARPADPSHKADSQRAK
jgi:hypothetical protein